MDKFISPTFFSISWLLCIVIALEYGRYTGSRLIEKNSVKNMAGFDMIGGSIFALWGLLIAFTLSGGASRFDQRRMLITEETNDIGTAYLRIDLLPENIQPEIRKLFRDYVDSRLTVYSNIEDLKIVKANLAHSASIQNEIWKKSVAGTKMPGAHVNAGILMLPALNAMIDITSVRLMSARIHPPLILYGLLFILGIACAFIAGYRMADGMPRNWLHVIIFALVIAMCGFVILSIEYPRMSFINLGTYDQEFVDLRNNMK